MSPPTLGQAARAYHRTTTFVEMDMENSYVKMFTSYFAVKASDSPIIYLIDTGTKQKDNIAKTKDVTESGENRVKIWQLCAGNYWFLKTPTISTFSRYIPVD